MEVTKTSYDVPAVRKAIRVISLLCETDTPLGVSDISRAVGINKNMAFRLLSTLVDEGWVTQQGTEPKYRVSLQPFQVVSGSVCRMSMRDAAIEPLRRLRQITGESVYLAVLHEYCCMFVEHLDGTHSIKIAGMVGGRYPLHCSAAGKVLFAHAENEVFDHLASSGFHRFTPNTICGLDELRAELEVVASQGWALDDEEHGRGILCFGAPVRDYTKRVIGAIGLSVPTANCSADELVGSVGKHVIVAADEISQQLGYAGAQATTPR